MPNNPKTLLYEFREKHLKEYEQVIDSAPPVSKALLHHIESMFVPAEIHPGDPGIKEKLVFQHGIERVLNYMRGLHERQENTAKRAIR